GAAELAPEQAAQVETVDMSANYVDFGGEVETTTSAIETINASRAVGFVASGPGHIEPISNCTIDGNASVITITDATQDASIKVVGDIEGATASVQADGARIDAAQQFVLAAGKNHGAVAVEFYIPEAATAADSAVAYDEASYSEPAYYEPVVEEYYESAPAEPAPVYEEVSYEPVYEEVADTVYYATDGNTTWTLDGPVNTTAFSGQAPHSMNGNEQQLAHEIFNSYNAYRASVGLPGVAWSDDCANMAYASAKANSTMGSLTHRLGIPAAVQTCYSDILQYSSWRMSGNEAVDKWRNSTGHRRQMQCNSSTMAGVGVFEAANGMYYYAIVYNFDGSNQSGN
ncbi:MAG: hypothetical protein BZ138_06595, partial [Methanosphaera sp. rholeuAM270]